jgi:tetratricopeptide (TPR) repeat protein
MALRNNQHLLACFLLLSFALSAETSGRTAEKRAQDDSSAVPHETRRVVNFDNWAVELLYGRAKNTPVDEQRQQKEAASSTTPWLIKPNLTLHSEITPRTSARRAAALRLAERGRKLLQAGAYETALLILEKSLALDSTPYTYYYLARAHHHLNNYQDSATFLDVAESRLSVSREWMAEVTALKRENVRALTEQAQEKQAAQERAENRAKQTTTVATLSLSAVFAFSAVLCFLAFAMIWSARFRRSWG